MQPGFQSVNASKAALGGDESTLVEDHDLRNTAPAAVVSEKLRSFIDIDRQKCGTRML